MDKINLEKILENEETYDPEYSTVSIGDALNAMKKACKQTLELAAEKANTKDVEDCHTYCRECGGQMVDKQSILDVINLIE